MTYTIGDLVRVDDRAAFRNDVQLDNFDNPQLNLGLIHSYLFSSALPGRQQVGQSQSIAPAGVLHQLVEAFANSRLDNRFYLIATYGHGKSHLALALANYFSRPYKSDEVKVLLEKLSNALGDRAMASRYNDFKQSWGEFLVLRLRGDVPRSLHEQVLEGLEKALGEHEATQGKKIPFWFSEAERIIGEFSTAEREKADRFLESAGYDCSLLLQRLGRREDVYDLCVKVIHHVKGIRPNLGGEVSLGAVVQWATNEFCGPGKPLGGLLILFDEFSLFVQRYARNSHGELQDLLNGVDKARGTAAFLAFSQFDLLQLADNLHIAGESRAGLKRELDRIPKKWVLFSIMESVVDAYLIQDAQRWVAFLEDKYVKGQILQATDIAWDRFNGRYANTLQWSFAQFQERVTRGCFPLHPITTYLLCNLRLHSDDASNPRTVLGFVLEALRTLEAEPAAVERRPNWILPINLVDYFEGRLSGDVFAQYTTARRTIGNDAPEEQQAVLKALLLQFLAEITVRRDEQIGFLAHAAGLEEGAAKRALRTLSDNNVIRYDHGYKVYTFWPASNQPKVLEETVQKKLGLLKWSAESLTDLNKMLAGQAGSNFGLIDVKVGWGHPTDWAAKEYIVTVDCFTPEWLGGLPALFGYNLRGLEEADRSAVLWVVATREDEIPSLRETVNNAIQTAFAAYSQNPPVVVAVVPGRAQPEMLETYRRRKALLAFNQQERDDAGKEMYDAELKQTEMALLRGLKAVRGDNDYPAEKKRPRGDYMVPTAYINEVRTSEQASLRELLVKLYRVAFAYGPNEFFDQYRVVAKGPNKLRDATRMVAEVLMQNATADLKALARSNSLVSDLCDKFLAKKWELLTADYRIREQPGSRRTREGWQHIDNAIKAGSIEIKLRDVLFTLINPPYGYDYNTALLLFAAWFGYHRLDLEVSVNGRRVEQKELLELVKKGARDLFQAIALSDIVTLKRRAMPDIAEVKTRIQGTGQKQHDLQSANDEIVWLRETAGDERYNVDIREGAKQAADNLGQAAELAEKYKQDTGQLKEQIARASTAQELITLQKKIGQLPTLGNVEAEAETPVELRQQIEGQLAAVVERVCLENESPTRVTEIGLHRRNLTNEKKAIAGLGLPSLIERIDASLAKLDQREAELLERQQEEQQRKNLQVVINSVDPQGRLKQLLEGRTTLANLADLPNDLVRQRDGRLQQVEKAITEIRSQIAQAYGALDDVEKAAQLGPIREKLVVLKQRCANSEEAAEIDALLARAEKIGTDLEEQARRHAEIREAIRRVDERGTLQQLRAGAEQLRAMGELPPDLARLQTERLKAVEQAIAGIQGQLKQAQRDLEEAQTVAQLDKLRNALYTLRPRCEETAEADEVERLLAEINTAQERLGQAEGYAAEVRKVIESADPKAPLKRLVEARQQLSELVSLPADLTKARDTRLAEIEQAVKSVRTQLDRARTDLAATRDQKAVNNLRDGLLRLQTRCVDTAEESEAAELIQQAERLQSELADEERRISEWRATIKGVNPNQQRLRPLLEGRATLQGLSSLPAALGRERDERLQAVEKAIAALEAQVLKAGVALDAVVNRSQLDKQRDQLGSLKQRCEGTPLERSLEEHLDRADNLRRFFEQIENERKPQVESPTSSHNQVTRLQQLMQAYKPQLSEQQQRLISELQEQVQKAAQGQRDTARRWMAEQEQAYGRKESITELDRQLTNPPAAFSFLSPTEQQSLLTLRQQVRQQIDEDTLTAIENRFRQLNNRQLQEQCLQRLQEILIHDNGQRQAVGQ